VIEHVHLDAARISCAAMSACRSEKPSTRSGCNATILSIFALVNAETCGFSRRRAAAAR
jgi:hypothetical protein